MYIYPYISQVLHFVKDIKVKKRLKIYNALHK